MRTPCPPFYRQKWECHQAVRFGDFQGVTMLDTPGRDHIWVPRASPALDNFFLADCRQGPMILLNADQQPAQPVQLAHKSPCRRHQTYVGTDNFLHILETVEKQGPWSNNSWSELGYEGDQLLHSMRWTTVHPDTGQNVTCVNRTYRSLDDKPVLHVSSGRALGMAIDQIDRSIAVIDSNSLSEISRLSMPQCQMEHQMWRNKVLTVAWSHTGSMLAVICAAKVQHQDWKRMEVCVYDTTTGQCLQQQPINPRSSTDDVLNWSTAIDALALCYQPPNKRRAATNPRQDGSCTEGASHGNRLIMLLEPSAPRARIVNCVREESNTPAISHRISGCKWSPCGLLLFVAWDQDSTGIHHGRQGFSIVDSQTLRVVFAAGDFEALGRMQWNRGAPSASSKSIKSVSTLWVRGMIVDFEQDQVGEWRAASRHITGFASDRHASLSPDCETLVGIQQIYDCLAHATRQSSWAQPETLIYSEQVWQEEDSPFQLDKHLKWAPFPSAWPSIYAAICPRQSQHRESDSEDSEPDSEQTETDSENRVSELGHFHHEGPKELVLVDGRRHDVIGRWTAAMLSQEARSSATASEYGFNGQGDDFESLEWAPNGRHIAVWCKKCTFIITFGSEAAKAPATLPEY